MIQSTVGDHPKRVGDALEDTVVQQYSLRYVPDSEAEWHDAETRCPVVPHPVDIAKTGQLVVRAGAPVEIKGASYRVGSRPRRGRFYLKRGQHRNLLDGGWYLFAVYVGDGRDDGRSSILTTAWRPAGVVDDVVDSWSAVDRAHSAVAKVAWSSIIDPARVPAPEEVET